MNATDLGDPRAVERTFVCIDLVGYTALTDTHGDGVAADLALALARVARTALRTGDELVKLLGDGILVACVEPDSALAFLDRMLAQLSRENFALAVRTGIHHGTAIAVEGDDYLGAAVNLAARLTHEARPGEIVGTDGVAQVASLRGDAVQGLGLRQLRHIGDAVDVFSVVLTSIPASTALDPVCHMRLDDARPAFAIFWGGRSIGFCSEACATRFTANPGQYADHVEDC